MLMMCKQQNVLLLETYGGAVLRDAESSGREVLYSCLLRVAEKGLFGENLLPTAGGKLFPRRSFVLLLALVS